jgi:ribosomal protein L22
MPYTFEPKQPHARAYSHMRISTKQAQILCAVLRRKKLSVAKRLLNGLLDGTADLRGKTYSKATEFILSLLESCEANAKNKGLDAGKLFVHASSHQGPTLRRARRKGKFGNMMKSTNVEIILMQREPKPSKKTKAPGAKPALAVPAKVPQPRPLQTPRGTMPAPKPIAKPAPAAMPKPAPMQAPKPAAKPATKAEEKVVM